MSKTLSSKPKNWQEAVEVLIPEIDTKDLVEPCTLQFGSEDMNKLVEYINKLAEKINGN